MLPQGIAAQPPLHRTVDLAQHGPALLPFRVRRATHHDQPSSVQPETVHVQRGITCQQLIQAIVNRVLLLRPCLRLQINAGRVVRGLGRRHGSRPPQREEEVLDGGMGREGGLP